MVKEVNLKITALITLISFVISCVLFWLRDSSVIGVFGGGSLVAIWIGIISLMAQLKDEPKKQEHSTEEKKL